MRSCVDIPSGPAAPRPAEQQQGGAEKEGDADPLGGGQAPPDPPHGISPEKLVPKAEGGVEQQIQGEQRPPPLLPSAQPVEQQEERKSKAASSSCTGKRRTPSASGKRERVYINPTEQGMP